MRPTSFAKIAPNDDETLPSNGIPPPEAGLQQLEAPLTPL
jgi:hypothetical protein